MTAGLGEYEAQFTRPMWPAADGGQNATRHLGIAVGDLPS
jgi:hypothetical protein